MMYRSSLFGVPWTNEFSAPLSMHIRSSTRLLVSRDYDYDYVSLHPVNITIIRLETGTTLAPLSLGSTAAIQPEVVTVQHPESSRAQEALSIYTSKVTTSRPKPGTPLPSKHSVSI